jgi:peptide/nickel transport system ATP-binding protein
VATPLASTAPPGRPGEVVLEADRLTKHFPVTRSLRALLSRERPAVHAVEDLDLALRRGRVTALVGESGSGKSTVARLLAQLHGRTSGDLRLHGTSVKARRGKAFRHYAGQVQMTFQDPFGSLNPTHTVRYHLTRALKIHHKAGRTKADLDAALAELLGRVSLTPAESYLRKYPHELSGGQRQRVAIARALAADPDVLLADEPVSMLDVSIRLGVLNLLRDLKERMNIAVLYITHDIASARYFADETMVMYAGRMVEGGDSETVTQHPAHPYTQLLIASAPDPDRITGGFGPAGPGAADVAGTTLTEDDDEPGEPPSLITPPAGCRFHPRCPKAMARCSVDLPPRIDIADAPGHWAACWLYDADTVAAPSAASAVTPAAASTSTPASGPTSQEAAI